MNLKMLKEDDESAINAGYDLMMRTVKCQLKQTNWRS